MCFNPFAVFNDNQVPEVLSSTGAFSDPIPGHCSHIPNSNHQLVGWNIKGILNHQHPPTSVSSSSESSVQKPIMMNIELDTCHIAVGASIMIEVSASDLVPSGRSCETDPQMASQSHQGACPVLRHFLISIDGMVVHWDLVAPMTGMGCFRWGTRDPGTQGPCAAKLRSTVTGQERNLKRRERPRTVQC